MAIDIGEALRRALSEMVFDFRKTFKVFVKEGKDEHFRKAIRSFDDQVEIKACATYFLVKTKTDESEIKNFTSVKYVEVSHERFG